ncbi:MAG: hypothetical protein K2W96_03545 [Gemmataceae bacterium]|nr:hypothetical protein [Gemmataceae bacterium]
MLSLLAAALLSAGAAPPASLAHIDRALPSPPKLVSPRYCLLVFGHDTRTRVWIAYDGSWLHALASPDGKAAPVWRHAGKYYSTFTVGGIRAADGKTLYRNLRVQVGGSYPRVSVDVRKHRQEAGWDREGKLAFGSVAKEVPVIHFDGPLTMALWRNQRPLRTEGYDDLGAVVGSRGEGPGTTAVFTCDAYPPKAWPVAGIEFPAKDGGKPILARVRLADD